MRGSTVYPRCSLLYHPASLKIFGYTQADRFNQEMMMYHDDNDDQNQE